MLNISDFIMLGVNLLMWYNVMLMLGFTNNDIIDNIKHNIAESFWFILNKFSIIQLKTHKYIITPFNIYFYKPIQHFLSTTQTTYYKIVFIKDGREILRVKSKDQIKNKDIDYDFILYYTNKFAILVLDIIDDIPDVSFIDPSIFKTKVSFMCCQMVAETGEEQIRKVFELDEFLLNNNEILSKNFVKWYCYKHFSREKWIKSFNFVDYKINIIDNDVNEYEINSNQYLTIRENECKVYSFTYIFSSDSESINSEKNNENNLSEEETDKQEMKEEVKEEVKEENNFSSNYDKPLTNEETNSSNSDDSKYNDFVKIANVDIEIDDIININNNIDNTVGALPENKLKELWEDAKLKSDNTCKTLI